MESLLRSIIITLNGIEVKGKNNLDKMLGCINALESIAEEFKKVEDGMEKGSE